MIALKKGASPQVLSENWQEWTKTILDRLAVGEKPTSAEAARYRHKDVKAALVNETAEKCAYCESKLLHVHHGDVEHIYPKSLDPSLTFKWENLTLACEICNQHKSNKDPKLEQIIDPYLVDPSLHLHFAGPLVFPKGTVEGTATRTILDLNRGSLVERRKDHLEKLMLMFDALMRPGLSAAVKAAIYEDFRAQACADGAQFAAMGRGLLQALEAA